MFNLGEQRSTFNVQLDSDVKFDANIEPEKIHTLIPEAYRTLANRKDYVFNLGEQRSTFNVQTDADMDPNSEPEKILVPQTTHSRYHTTYYDKKNSLWREEPELLQHLDTINPNNVDPWVYEFSSEVMKDIKHSHKDNKPPGANDKEEHKHSLGQSSDINTTSYINQEVNMMAKPNVDSAANIYRSKEAPTGPAVKGWDGLVQKNGQSEDIAKNKYVNNEVHMFTDPQVEQIPYSRKTSVAPKKGDQINGWSLQ